MNARRLGRAAFIITILWTLAAAIIPIEHYSFGMTYWIPAYPQLLVFTLVYFVPIMLGFGLQLYAYQKEPAQRKYLLISAALVLILLVAIIGWVGVETNTLSAPTGV